ncbi:MAG: AEC family transporter [Planctomycetota bacterium]
MNFDDIFFATLPVFLMVGLGYFLRVIKLVDDQTETKLIRVILNVFYPCFILANVPGNQALSDPKVVGFAFSIGFGLMCIGMSCGYLMSHIFRIREDQGRRTFCLSLSIQNYGFLPIPLIEALFPDSYKETLGVLFVNNLGLETGLWTVGLIVLSGRMKNTWRRLINGPSIGITLGLLLNFTGWDSYIPGFGGKVIEQLGLCAIPVSLLIVGATIAAVIEKEKWSLDWRIASGATLARFLIMPAIFFAVAFAIKSFPELRCVLLVQAAMPAAVFPIVLARHYGGKPSVATQVVVVTTALSLVITPGILTLGLKLLSGD